ncbi:hypothetical protein Leryth_008940 [Lithospermum erythrorhizon]|nr:hypothetical protein Leryth_008940 [Lithospermum erythrorhizon]
MLSILLKWKIDNLEKYCGYKGSVMSECKPNARIVGICEKGDSFTKERVTSNMYKNVEKKIERGRRLRESLLSDMHFYESTLLALAFRYSNLLYQMTHGALQIRLLGQFTSGYKQL